jgi:hypothetical protein
VAIDAACEVVATRLGQPKDKVVQEVKRQLSSWFHPYNGGSEYAAWVSYLSFVRDIVGWSCSEHDQYKDYEDAAIYGGPRFLHKKFCVLCDRAAVRDVNEEMQLHSESRPALQWRCGSARWFIDGIEVDEQIVMRSETQTIEQINAEENEDVRSIRIERFGWDRYLQDSRPIDQRYNAVEGTLEELHVLPNGSRRFVATDPSGKLCSLGVPPEIDTCEGFARWFDPSEEKSNILGRT